ncbi:MAG: protein-export chaperone SecB [Candidatus Cloacimonadaceae bacterium]|nr:protein-export chaperone SecB [Candidatus Cloacimonadaceae bacterium]
MKDDTQAPMIKTEAIFLIESNFIRYPENSQVIIPSVEIDYESNVRDKIGQGFLSVNITCTSQESGQKVFEARIRYLGVFREDESDPNMGIDEFMKVNAPAHMYPFVREFVASLSTRSNMPSLILPPINIAAMIKVQLDGEVSDNKINIAPRDIK